MKGERERKGWRDGQAILTLVDEVSNNRDLFGYTNTNMHEHVAIVM